MSDYETISSKELLSNEIPKTLYRSNIVGLENQPAYEVTDHQLGSGGQGKVYEVVDVTTHEHYAAKFLIPQGNYEWFKTSARPPQANDGDSPWTSSHDEALIGYDASVQHPNIIKTYDFIEQGQWKVIIQELVNGPTLQEALAGATYNRPDVHFSSTGVARMITELANAVDYMGSKGIYHQDLKPGNIFLTQEGIKIGDFGVSSYENETHSVGTPDYVAPERLTIKATRGTVQGEVYSMGIVAYEALFGEHPYTVDLDLDTARKRFSRKIEGPNKEEKWEKVMAVLRKATEDKPEDRYQTATEFAKEFEDALLGKVL